MAKCHRISFNAIMFQMHNIIPVVLILLYYTMCEKYIQQYCFMFNL